MVKKKQIKFQSGELIPDREDFELVQEKYPNESPEEKFRLAQAVAIIRWYEDNEKSNSN